MAARARLISHTSSPRRGRSHMVVVFFTLCYVAGAAVRPAVAQTTVAADTFVDAAGVNIHLHYDNTLYRDNFPLVQSRLIELGLRHVRDGLINTTWQAYYDRHNSLGRAGVTVDFVSGPGMLTSVLQAYPSRMADAFEAYEAPNEYNLSGDPNWVATMRTTLAQLHALRDQPALARFPVFGPSLTDTGAQLALGDVSALIDYGNMHNYFGGRNPGTGGWGDDGYGSIDWNLRQAGISAGPRPIITTETGYLNDPLLASVIPEQVAGTYMPRILLEQFRKGINRTYLYELCDLPWAGIPDQSGYGLLRSDGSPKPAFNAVKGLLNLLSDPGVSFVVTPLAYTVQTSGANVHSMAFQKRDGSYFLALWIEESGFDMSSGTPTTVPAQSATVVLSKSVELLTTNQWQADGEVVRITGSKPRGSVTLPVSDRLVVLELHIKLPPPPTNVRLATH
jgi:hypothetical protein